MRFGQVASFPTPVKHAPVVELKKFVPVEENGKRIQNNRARGLLPETENRKTKQ